MLDCWWVVGGGWHAHLGGRPRLTVGGWWVMGGTPFSVAVLACSMLIGACNPNALPLYACIRAVQFHFPAGQRLPEPVEPRDAVRQLRLCFWTISHVFIRSIRYERTRAVGHALLRAHSNQP